MIRTCGTFFAFESMRLIFPPLSSGARLTQTRILGSDVRKNNVPFDKVEDSTRLYIVICLGVYMYT